MDYRFIDLHTDTLFKMMDENLLDSFSENTSMHIDLPKIKKGKPLAITLAMFTEDKTDQLTRTAHLNQMLCEFFNIVRSNDQINQAHSVNDIFLANDSGKYSVILAIEGSGGLQSHKDLYWLHRLGLRILSPVWNNTNIFASGNDEPDNGLTTSGKALINTAKELGVVLDISHLNYKGFFEVVEIMESTPFIATHSNAYRLCPTPRNLKDEQIKAIKESGGIIGITFYNDILKKDSNAGIDEAIRHIDYIVDKAGIDHIAIGTDFDGIERALNEISDISMMQRLFKGLEDHGYKEKHIKKIACENALRVFSTIWK